MFASFRARASRHAAFSTNLQRHGSRHFTSTPPTHTDPTALPPFSPSPSFSLTQSPNPSWNLGRGLDLHSESRLAAKWKEDEGKGWKTWDMDETPGMDRYRLLTSAIGPRPIAFVSSLSAEGVPNLAPFSYFNMVAHDPPLLMISFSLSPRKPKDTRENIKVTKEFVVNLISEPFIEAANACSVEAPEEVDEWVVSGLTREESTLVKPPRVRESAVSLECSLYHLHDIPSPTSPSTITTTMILGQIKLAHVRNAVLSPEGTTVDPGKLRPVGRMGGITYTRLGEGFELGRPSWREIEGEVGALVGKGKNGER